MTEYGATGVDRLRVRSTGLANNSIACASYVLLADCVAASTVKENNRMFWIAEHHEPNHPVSDAKSVLYGRSKIARPFGSHNAFIHG